MKTGSGYFVNQKIENKKNLDDAEVECMRDKDEGKEEKRGRERRERHLEI